MASHAQNLANSANAQRSTGPKSDAGKQAVARNSLSHGLSSKKFAVLPQEDAAGYKALLRSLHDEFQPQGPAEAFLVEEMARSQWKLRRIAGIEHELLAGQESLTAWFKEDCSQDQVLMKLGRYENTARRAWYKALAELRKIRSERSVEADREARAQNARADAEFHAVMSRQLAIPEPWLKPLEQNDKTKPIGIPIPPNLAAELDSHKRRDPDFDPQNDRSQMSKELRRWFDKRDPQA